MTKSVVFTVLIIISIAATTGVAWRLKNNRRLLINKRCREQCPVTDGCILEPRTSDLLSLATFREQIVNRLLNAIYRIEGPKIPESQLPFTGRQEYKFILMPDTGVVFLALKSRVLGAKNCTIIPPINFGRPTSNTHAVFDIPNFDFQPVDGRCYVIGKHSDEFLFLLCCLDLSTIRNGKCNGSFFVDVMLFSPSLDRVPWKKIECDLREKLGLKMTDDRNHFLFLGKKCPEIL